VTDPARKQPARRQAARRHAARRPPAPATRPPGVDALLRAAEADAAGLDDRDRAAVLDAARAVIADERAAIAKGAAGRSPAALAAELLGRLDALEAPDIAAAAVGDEATGSGLVPAINATGVLLHTNLGRAAWAEPAIEAARLAASTPSFLELDVETGRRGLRFRTVEDEVVALTGAADALITNNNAAAVALAVGLAGRGGVAVSRGELVEIGGGVRIPEIVRRAGARLVEVGTTNRTRVPDFEEPLADGRARAVLRVHPSNFAQAGFVEAPDAAELAAAAHRHGAIVIDDLGSGALIDTARFGLAHEPMPRERLDAGADLVTFSGDKLVGGPQAGIIAGRADLIARLRRDPLARAMRPDKVLLAALAATLRLYRAGVAQRDIPVWRQITTPQVELERRAVAVLADLASGPALTGAVPGPRLTMNVKRTESTIGGGSLPGQVLPSWAIAIGGLAPQRLLASLRAGEPAVIARVVDDEVVLDLRTVEPRDDEALGKAIRAAVSALTGSGRA
jgi:L-seryl-tRNA(Ser) seleniumtransferase